MSHHDGEYLGRSVRVTCQSRLRLSYQHPFGWFPPGFQDIRTLNIVAGILFNVLIRNSLRFTT